jgi:hypothetical protein
MEMDMQPRKKNQHHGSGSCHQNKTANDIQSYRIVASRLTSIREDHVDLEHVSTTPTDVNLCTALWEVKIS